MQAVQRVLSENASLQHLNYQKWLKANGQPNEIDGIPGAGDDNAGAGASGGSGNDEARWNEELRLLNDQFEAELRALKE